MPPVLLSATGNKLPVSKQATAAIRLGLFQQALRSTDQVPIDSIRGLTPESPSELVLQATAIIQANLVDDPSELTSAHAALAGVGVTMALLDVIAKRAAMNREPVCAIEPIAKKSVKTALELATHDEHTDEMLTIALSTYKARDYRDKTPEELFSNLKFKPEFFLLTDGVVSVDYFRRKELFAHGCAVDFTPNKNEILLGCPFYSRIGRLYGTMLDVSLKLGFLEAAYDSIVLTTSSPEQ